MVFYSTKQLVFLDSEKNREKRGERESLLYTFQSLSLSLSLLRDLVSLTGDTLIAMGVDELFSSIDWEREAYPAYEDFVSLPFFVLFFLAIRFFLDRYVFEVRRRFLGSFELVSLIWEIGNWMIIGTSGKYSFLCLSIANLLVKIGRSALISPRSSVIA